MNQAVLFTSRFDNWRDLLLTPFIQASSLIASVGILVILRQQIPLDLWVCVVLFYPLFALVTILSIRVLHIFYPLDQGIYCGKRYGKNRFAFNCFGYLCTTSLWPLYGSNFLPPVPSVVFPFSRKFFYRLMGARIGKGIVPIAGHLLDPSLTEIGKNVMIGAQSIIMAHAITNSPENTLVLKKVVIADNVIIGAGSILLPGVKVGESSVVLAMSLVSMNTRIPPFEVWGGNPAGKVADLARPEQRNAA